MSDNNKLKLSINKFRIAKLTGSEKVIGGALSETTDDPTDLTDKDAPTEPVCIKTSKEVIYPFGG